MSEIQAPTSTEDQLKWLVDRVEIEGVFIRFFEALDFLQWELLDQVFTPDARGFWALGTTTEGREATVGYIRERFVGLGPTHHMMGNFVADISGDVAPTSCRARVYHAGAEERSHLFEESLATYRCRAVRTPHGWRFDEFSQQLQVMLGTTEVFAVYNRPSRANGES